METIEEIKKINDVLDNDRYAVNYYYQETTYYHGVLIYDDDDNCCKGCGFEGSYKWMGLVDDCKGYCDDCNLKRYIEKKHLSLKYRFDDKVYCQCCKSILPISDCVIIKHKHHIIESIYDHIDRYVCKDCKGDYVKNEMMKIGLFLYDNVDYDHKNYFVRNLKCEEVNVYGGYNYLRMKYLRLKMPFYKELIAKVIDNDHKKYTDMRVMNKVFSKSDVKKLIGNYK